MNAYQCRARPPAKVTCLSEYNCGDQQISCLNIWSHFMAKVGECHQNHCIRWKSAALQGEAEWSAAVFKYRGMSGLYVKWGRCMIRATFKDTFKKKQKKYQKNNSFKKTLIDIYWLKRSGLGEKSSKQSCRCVVNSQSGPCWACKQFNVCPWG